MLPVELFRYCPRCAAPRATDNSDTPFRCGTCGLVYYFNPTVAAGAIIRDADGRVLLIRRAHEPSAGKFGVPGGFIDFGESAEDGLRREVREEVGLEIDRVNFLVSHPNIYFYREVSYPVVDLYFTALAIAADEARPLDGVARVEWRMPGDIPDDEIAFPSLRIALARYVQGS